MPTTTQGVKFSNFVNGGNVQSGDQVVGLRTASTSGATPVNTIFNFGFNQITQNAHGFSVGNVLKLAGASYALAQANNAANALAVGIVTKVVDVNNFYIQYYGYSTGLTGLAAGTLYYLSPTSPGGLTATAPVTAGQILKPILIADSATSAYWLNYNGQQL